MSPIGSGPCLPKPVVHSETYSFPSGPKAMPVMAVRPRAYTVAWCAPSANRYTFAAPGPPSKFRVPIYRAPSGPMASEVGTDCPFFDSTVATVVELPWILITSLPAASTTKNALSRVSRRVAPLPPSLSR